METTPNSIVVHLVAIWGFNYPLNENLLIQLRGIAILTLQDSIKAVMAH